MNNSDYIKERAFFRNHLRDVFFIIERGSIDKSIIREMISDSLPMDYDYISKYLRQFPESLNSKIFDSNINCKLKHILHDTIVAHAYAYVHHVMDSKGVKR